MNDVPKFRLRILAGTIIVTEWITKAQLETYWADIRRYAATRNGLILIDNPRTNVTHIFPIDSPSADI